MTIGCWWFNGELVAATRRTPGHVVGDGEHTITQLIDTVNQESAPRGGPRKSPDAP